MTCAHCECENTKKHGKDRHGNPRYKCKDCGKTFLDKPPAPLGASTLELKRAAFALGLMLEGMSVRATSRMTGIDKNVLCDLILRVGENCERFLLARVRGVRVDDVQADELWSFTACKERTRNLRGYSPEVGDTYTFLGLASDSKLILAHHVGRRSHEDADAFAGKLRLAVAGRTQVNTDGFRPYRSVIPVNFGGDVDHAVLVKKYGTSPDGEGAQRRYSPAQIIGIDRERSFGSPDMTRLSTSYAERLNLSVRMGLRRFTRLTNGFSKSRRHHAAMVALFCAHYNFCKRHSAVKTTPAVAAGIAREPWSIERLLTEAAA